MSSETEKWETVIGLEVHVQLNTNTKLFSPALNRFGQEPNVDIHPICTGQPGSLPKLNRAAVIKALKLGLALGSRISEKAAFDRKSYFYPDSPRNFQITQFATPLLTGGHLDIEIDGLSRRFSIDRAHLEDDAGMLKHFSEFSGIDYNRAGIPLIEIVTQPDFTSALEASCFITELKALIEYADIGDCNMERGQLRVDANISVRPDRSHPLRSKVEIKNLNSLAAMRDALQAESTKQKLAYSRGESVLSATARWDSETQSTQIMRLKESAQDYRFCPEPDLPPLIITQDLLDAARASLPELPREKRLRYINSLGLSRYAADTLLLDRQNALFFERALASSTNVDAKSLCNWITVEFAGRLAEGDTTLATSGITHTAVAELVELLQEGEITGKTAKSIADEMVAQPELSPRSYLREHPQLRAVGDQSKIEPIVDAVLEDNRQGILDYLGGKQRAFGHLVGQVMARTKGTASPGLVNRLLMEKIRASAPGNDTVPPAP